MLTFDQLNVLGDPIVALYERFHTSVIRDIARRLSKLKFSPRGAAWQAQRLIESGMVYEDVIKQLGKVSGKSEAELMKIFREAGVTSIRFDDLIYQAAGLKPLPLNLSPAMLDVLMAGLNKTLGVIRNLTLSTAQAGQEAFIDAADLAYMQVSTGAMSYTQAIKEAIKELTNKGIRVIHYGGRQEQLDVALRRTVLTGVSQTTGAMSITRADEMGQDLVAVSAHIGARNKGEGPANHESWQGKVYSRSGSNLKYGNFYAVTGYGTGEGLGGWNCRHSFYPFFEGISEGLYTQKELDSYANKAVAYNSQEMSFYEATQKQRAIERAIRKAKREEAALEAAGLEHDAESAKVRALQAKMRDFVKQTGLQRQGERERITQYEPEKKTIGFSFLSGDSNLTTTQDAIDLGNSSQGWNYHEHQFREDYLKPFNLKDDVTQTIGYWGGPEPSFNASVTGAREDFVAMAGKWGKDYNQQAMAVLLPNKNSKGGKITWTLDHQLNNLEWDYFFSAVDRANKELAKEGDYFGVTTKFGSVVEFWFDTQQTKEYSLDILNRALKLAGVQGKLEIASGYEFLMLFKGSDY